uniref:Secreted protein n=1 Tax=Mesocestoides corti TaxID=53468 RepID=A0A5K3FF22_MESCO
MAGFFATAYAPPASSRANSAAFLPSCAQTLHPRKTRRSTWELAVDTKLRGHVDQINPSKRRQPSEIE